MIRGAGCLASATTPTQGHIHNKLNMHDYQDRSYVEYTDGTKQVTSNAGATLAFVKTDKGFFGSLALCNPMDNYCKATGREFSSRFLTHNMLSIGARPTANGEPRAAIEVDPNRHFFAETDDMTAFVRAMDSVLSEYGYEPSRKRTVH